MEKHRDRVGRREALKMVCLGKTKRFENKMEEMEFGPWKRNLTGDFDGFI